VTLRARAVSKAFRRRLVLDGVELSLDGPGIVRVEGANGAGKSTLLRLLAGVSRPTRGAVDAGGARAFVPERFRATGALRAGELLRLAGGEPALGIDDLLRRPMAALSQGQAQRVALAAAVTKRVDVLLLDEPFTALDAASAGELESRLVERAREALVIVADHEARLAPTTSLRVAGKRVEIGGAAPRVRIRTGPAATPPEGLAAPRSEGLSAPPPDGLSAPPEGLWAPPLAGAQRDGEGWLIELPRDEAQAALAALIAAGVEIREVRPL
jgi:ABC-2 type transport system ATP-binding protein